ncbi:hypothetical protein CCR75_008614 [Bremia lactucae]|uniref:Transmembrane protein n=1 Tax=Bremia lactucae TaxID=4779 RepID=A0A976IF20_BRELC|nr:hypothetical protein CCR75_008614 [Bremia lactucae]
MGRRNLFKTTKSDEKSHDVVANDASTIESSTTTNCALEPPYARNTCQYLETTADFTTSFATTAPTCESTRRDKKNLLDIPIISSRRSAISSICALVDFDGGLVSAAAVRHNTQGISINASCSEPSYDGTIEKGSLNFVSSRHVGLLASTLFAGILITCLKRALLPLLTAELVLASYQVDAAKVLMLLPWSYTFMWGFLSDTFPLLGSRRKSYILAGWVVSLLACFAMAILNYTLEYHALSRNAATEEALHDRVALIDGYIGLLMLASFGCVLTINISQTYVVAQTRREPLAIRGRALATLLLTQFVGELMGQMVSDKAIFNITEFGPTPLVSFRETALFFMFFSLVPLLALFFFFHEDPDPPPIDDGEYVGIEFERLELAKPPRLSGWTESVLINWERVRQVLAKKSTIRVLVFFIIFIFLSEFTLTYPHVQLGIWCDFTVKAQSTSDITLEVVYVLAAATWKFCALNWNWRSCILGSLLVITIVPQFVYFALAAWIDSLRNQEVFSLIKSLHGYLRASVVIVEVAICAEIAPVGGEGAVVGIIVSMSSIMRLLSTTFSNALGYAFQTPSLRNTEQESSLVTFGLIICYCVKLMSALALLFLPKQKEALQRLHRTKASSNRDTTWWVLGALGVALVISAVFNMLAVSPSTACLRIVGGGGCSD